MQLYAILIMGGVLSIETVIEPRNIGAKQVLLLKAGLAGIELCGIHKHHHTDPEVEPNIVGFACVCNIPCYLGLK